jgi:hypothetical protein
MRTRSVGYVFVFSEIVDGRLEEGKSGRMEGWNSSEYSATQSRNDWPKSFIPPILPFFHPAPFFILGGIVLKNTGIFG